MKVHIDYSPYAAALGMWFTYELNGKLYIVKPMQWEVVEQPDDVFETPAPSLSVPFNVKDAFMRALAEALSEEGIQTTNQHKLEGILEARGEHLNDMRKLVFKEGSDDERNGRA